MEIKILNGNNYLTYDTPIRTNFEWKNIDPKTGSIYGAGIKMLGTKNGITKTEINVPSNYLESDTLNIKLHFEINGEKTGTEFNVPVKNKILRTTLYIKNCYFVLNQWELLCLLASDFPSENPRTQTRNISYT